MVSSCTEDEPVDQRTLPLNPWKGVNPELPLWERVMDEYLHTMGDVLRGKIDEDVLREFNLTSTPPR